MPAYVIIEGTVYDVSDISAWKDGKHFGITAGVDVTETLQTCHKNIGNVINKLRVVGVLEQKTI